MGFWSIILWPLKLISMFFRKKSRSQELQRVMKERSPISIRYEKSVKANDMATAGRLKERLGRYDKKVGRLRKETKIEQKERMRDAESRTERRKIKKDYRKVLRVAE